MRARLQMNSHMKFPIEFALSLTLVSFFALVHKESNCLRISSIEVPAAVWNGSQVTFSCNYVLAPDEQSKLIVRVAASSTQCQLYSVKWYKNYVEFYRFQPTSGQEQATSLQPAQPQEPTAAGQVGQNLNLNRLESEAPAGTRHEFELDGINLDLSKSNATQVHLRQVNLSSEATFKCEVSADSPTFATVSAERQLKVYALPKQKLALIDNSAGGGYSQQAMTTTTTSSTFKSQNNEQPAARIQNNARQLIYQLNELVNFTCIAGASRPAARLSWLLNDEPILLANSSRGASVLEANEISHELKWLPNGLAEARSRLVLRLQASHLKILRKQNGANSMQRSQATYSSPLLPLKLSCLSRLSVEFSSEASVQVSNGKSASAKLNGRRQEFISSLPMASSWTSEAAVLRARNRDNRFQFLEEASSGAKWLPSELASERQQRFRSTGDALTEAWIGPVDERVGSSASVLHENRRQQRARHNVVWTQRQLRAQADRIEQRVQRSRPNQLESPHIEAQSLGRQETARTTTDFDATEREPSGEPDDEERTTPSPPSIVISSHQFGLGDELTPSGHSKGRPPNRDYELDEVVNFTCQPAIASGNLPARQADDPPLSVQFKWFINEQEITGNQVNNFDGERFQNVQSELNKTTARPANWLLVEFTSSLMQLKELNLKCRTIVEQPLIEDEIAQVISLSASPFIQATSEQMLGQRGPAMRPSLFTVRDPQQRQQQFQRFQLPAGGDGSDQTTATTAAGGQQGHRPNVIRMRHSQQARSHSNASSKPLGPPILWLCLAGLLAARLASEQTRHIQHVR